MNRHAITLSCALCCAALIAATSGPAAAQNRQPSAMQQGAGQMMYGSCMVDVLSPSQKSAAAALAALSPAVAATLATATDETDQIAMWCSKAIHDQRCTTKIVAVLGDQLSKGNPAAKAKPPSANAGALVGGAVGGVLGLLGGNEVGHPYIGAGAGMWAGAKAGGKYWNGAVAGDCMKNSSDLDRISTKLGGTLGPLGTVNEEDVRLLIVGNLQARRITQAEADQLQVEVTTLSGKVDELLDAMK
jgi:hypothetical protein